MTLDRDSGPEPPDPQQLAQQLESIREQLEHAIAEQRGATTSDEKLKSDWAVNTDRQPVQSLEIISGKDLVSTLRSRDAESGEGPSLDYVLPATVSIASRSDQQMVQLFKPRSPGAPIVWRRRYYVATSIAKPS